MRDSDPSVGHQSQTPQETSKPPESEQTVWPGRSPLTSELLAPDEELTEMLDYEDVEENDPGVPDRKSPRRWPIFLRPMPSLM